MTELVGRRTALARLTEALRAPSRGGPASVVVVEGIAGMGKSTLIRAAVADQGGNVAWGTCWSGDGAPAFWPWIEAFDQIVSDVGAETARRAADELELVAVLARRLGPAIDLRDEARLLMLQATVRWLRSIAQAEPLTIVLDDLQWADPSTLDLLELFASAPRTAPLAVVGAYRHDEVDDELRHRLTRIAAGGTRITLSGLTEAEVAELASHVNPGASAVDVATLHRRTGGHPLFVSELARLAPGDSLPVAVRDAVGQRLRGLPDATRDVVDVSSVVGNRVLADVVSSVLGVDQRGLADALVSAVEAGMMRRTDDGGFAFTHDIHRETVVDELGESRRRMLHQRIADALVARSRRGVEVASGDVAEHFVAALPEGDPSDAVEWVRRAAGDDRSRAAFTEAAGRFERLRTTVATAGVDLGDRRRVEILLEEADCRARAGDPDAAHDVLRLADAAASSPAEIADIALAVQQLGSQFATRRDDLVQRLETALALNEADDVRRARLSAALARELQHSVAADRARAEPLSLESLDLGRACGDDATLAECLIARHDALWLPGRGAERAGLAREVAEVARRIGNDDRLADGLILEANGLLESGRREFRTVLAAWSDLLSDRNEPHDRYLVETRRVALALIDGDVELAASAIETAAELGRRVHEPDTGNVYMSQLIPLTRERGDPDAHLRLADGAVAHWKGAPVHAHAVAAGARAAAGDLPGAAAEIRNVEAAGGWRTEGSYLRSVLVPHLAEAAVAVEDEQLCRDLLDDLDALTNSCGVNGAVVAFAGPFAYPAARLRAALGDDVGARACLERALTICRELDAPTWVRRVEAAAADLGASASEPAHAVRAELRRARSGWTVRWGDVTGAVRHVKGLGDIARLIVARHDGISALELMAGPDAPDPARQDLVDQQALAAYRQRLADIDVDLDAATDANDLGRVDRLEHEREQLLAELQRSVGIGGRTRSHANEPAERARKAVSARIRGAIARVADVSPDCAGHLDRSIRTGLRCSYEPPTGEPSVEWDVTDTPPA